MGIEIVKVEPAFAGRSFGDVGSYERVIGRAYGEVDPKHAANGIIQDLEFAPTTAKGGVGIFHQLPQFQETTPPLGNPNIGSNRAIHYGLGAEPRTLRAIAGDLGVSAERVRQIEQGALEKLRATCDWAEPRR